jgi:hypothetical protein
LAQLLQELLLLLLLLLLCELELELELRCDLHVSSKGVRHHLVGV